MWGFPGASRPFQGAPGASRNFQRLQGAPGASRAPPEKMRLAAYHGGGGGGGGVWPGCGVSAKGE